MSSAIMRCCNCTKKVNSPVLERTKTEPIFDNLLGKFKKVTTVIGYLCKTCARKEYATKRPKGMGWRAYLKEVWEQSQKKVPT